MFCSNCGKKLDQHDKFCGACGTQSAANESTSTPSLPNKEPLEDQEPVVSSNENANPDGSQSVLPGLFGLIVFLGISAWLYLGESVPHEFSYEVSNKVSKVIDVKTCKAEKAHSAIYCEVEYKGATGFVTANMIPIVFYDKNGTKLGNRSFPDNYIHPGETVRSILLAHNPLEDVHEVIIGEISKD
jgi:hypothetical protein